MNLLLYQNNMLKTRVKYQTINTENLNYLNLINF